MKLINKAIGLHMKNARVLMGFTQADLADKVHCCLDTIHRLEKGIICNPELFGSICKVLNVTYADLSAIVNTKSYVIHYKGKQVEEDEEEKEIIRLSADLYLKQAKKKNYIIGLIATAVATFALIANSEAIAAKLRKLWEVVEINEEKHYVRIRSHIEGEEETIFEPPDTKRTLADFFYEPAYLPIDEKITHDGEYSKAKLKYRTAQGQEYVFYVQEAGATTGEHIKKELNYECEEREVLIENKIVTVYFKNNNAFFLLDGLCYEFYRYDFSTEQLIGILEKMEKQIIKDQFGEGVTIMFQGEVEGNKNSTYEPEDIMTLLIYQPESSENERLQVDYAEESGIASIRFRTEKKQEYMLDIQVAKKTTEEYANFYLHDSEKGIITGKGVRETLYYSSDEKMVLFLLDDLLYVFYDYDFHISQIFQIVVTMKKQTLNSEVLH